ncbi:5-formyltetrahydrofolate cyclo-ligase [Kaistella solincola]|uniref:5-formyltetrahydrofolate cyclo-ligase n=1 Tax=Kaistella solincola TaxID=510955 RepID=A0ABR4ZSU3_9FLAO|nr:5-formyltetrahydrofolate cyclo-ligase [Kaistella solincola]KIA84338.1 5-formyltetrahydrofolate cyclo-ligase [Kaistella solincola]
MTKTALRKLYSEKKMNLSLAEVQNLSEEIFRNFNEKFQLSNGQKVHCFLSISKKKEVETAFFLNYFFQKNIRVFVPKIVNEKIIAIEILAETPLVTNSWGIKEPVGNEDSGVKDFDLVIMPLLYADKKGNRVGYGKGFYDRFLTNINENVLKVGVSFFPPESDVEDISEFDIPLDYLVTPTDVLSFGNFESKSTK